MAEVTYRSPGFFESEIDLSITTPGEVTATPAGVIGPTPIGPAFVPVTVASLSQFRDRFFGSDDERNNSYFAGQEFFRNGSALTFLRTLGAGANSTSTDIYATQGQGTVKGAGFVIKGSAPAVDPRAQGAVQLLVAKHIVTASTDDSYPVFFDNDSFSISTGADGTANLLRGVLFFPTGTRGQILDYNQAYSPSNVSNDSAKIQTDTTQIDYRSFKLVISSSATGFGTTDGYTGIKIYTASLDPNSANYISNVLNTSPELFQTHQHLLYLDFPVEDALATVSGDNDSVGLLSGSANTSSTSGLSSLSFLDAFGRYDTRYRPARTTTFISQPYAGVEYDLFHFETIADGASANNQFKISIANMRRSTDPQDPYGTFDVLVRAFNDTDGTGMSVLEQYVGCSINPNSDSYIAAKIGDKKRSYNFDAVNPLDKRLVSTGQYTNNSTRIRVIVSDAVKRKTVPANALPFGFKGIPTLKITDGTTDTSLPALSRRLGGVLPAGGMSLTGSLTPPVPLRYKVTTSETLAAPTFQGQEGSSETANQNIFWGVKFDAFPSVSGTLGSSAYLQSNYNVGEANASGYNPIITAYSKFAGIEKLDTVTSGSGADVVNNNKFTLANVALYNSKAGRSALTAAVTDLTGTLEQHMVNAIYVRNATPSISDGTISDASISGRLTFGTLALIPSASIFNRFSPYIKYTNMFYGGFDGLNILDKDMSEMNDKSTSTESGGKAIASPNIGLNVASNNFSAGVSNSLIGSYRTAVDIMTNAASSRANIITIPGIRDPLVTDYAATEARDFARAIYLMDIPAYTDSGVRIFANNVLPDVTYTIRNFSGRNINNNYVATYFPDASIIDESSTSGNRRVRVPSSIIALGALAQNDARSYPWYAPAGFNRTALSSVTNLAVRLTSADRDNLYDARINPITAFPGLGYVIFGQKTLQLAKSALDRVNVRRLLIELARIVTSVGLQFVFEPNIPSTRSRFVSLLAPQFATVQSQSGIDSFRIIMDDSNNTQQDIEANRLNGRIVIVPTKAVEYIAVDFIITNEGVEFV